MKKTCHRALVLTAACLSMSALGGKAAASPLTSISWTVTGGTLFVDEVLGTTADITGGSVVWTSSSAMSTPTIMPVQTSLAGSLRITLQTAGAGVALTFRSLIGTITPLYAALGGPYQAPDIGAYAIVNYFDVYHSVRVFFLNGAATDDWHVATLGQEVRTATPEPSSAALVGLGLLFLAWTAGAGAREWRSRARLFEESQE